ALALDHDALEHLDALAIALDDAEMHAHGVARLEARDFAQLTALEFLDRGAHVKRRGRKGRNMLAEGRPEQPGWFRRLPRLGPRTHPGWGPCTPPPAPGPPVGGALPPRHPPSSWPVSWSRRKVSLQQERHNSSTADPTGHA